MVLLKDILNQDNHEDPDSSQSNASDGGRRSSNCLPSPTLSASSQLSNSGNVDGDNYYLADTRRSSCDSAAGGHAGTPQSELSSGSEEEHLVCRWDTCGKVFNQAELLYHHLCKDHVGRKSQKNLQLDCKWGDCQAKTEKRDHITSHLRVHIALKPFKCTTCGKNFKRPQDLKKHLKTHIESHIIFKKKRGPKVGSKRVSKKELDRKDSTGNDSAGSPLNRSSSPSGQSLISLQQLVTNELPSYEPIYSQRLGARLNTVLPPISADDNLPRSAPLATTSAAHFFSALSTNMLNSRPVQQPVYQHVQKPVINIEPPAAGTAPLAGTLGHATYPKIRPLPPIEPQFIPDRNSTLPSLSSVPFFVPRHQTFERVSHFNNPAEYYSTVQRSSGRSDASEQQDLTEALTSLDIASYDEEYEETLETVNLIRDYLVCLLLEDEYADESKSTGSHPARERISRYPQVVM